MTTVPQATLLVIINLLSGCIAATVCPEGVTNCTKEIDTSGSSDTSSNYSETTLHRVPLYRANNTSVLDLSNKNISYLHNDTFNEFENVTIHKVYLKHNRIAGMDYGTFRQIASLSELDLESNVVARILPGTFSNNPKLEILNLRNNSLTELPVDVMTLKNRVKELDLGLNSIREVDMTKVQKYYPRLKRLDVSKNKITHWTSTDPKRHSSLEVIDASYNYISQIDPSTFSSANKLKELNVSNNEIKSLGEDAFKNNSYLTKIDISRNHIITIHRNAFRNNPNITEVYAGHNRMTYLHPDTFRKNPRLTTVTVSWNDIKKIDSATFSNNPLLESVNFNKNKIEEVHPNAFANNPNLKSVDLSNNFIVALESGTFSNNPKLEYLFLNKNRHIRVHDGLLIRASTLKLFDLKHCNLTKLPKGLLDNSGNLKELNLGDNNLTTLANLTDPENSEYVDTLTRLEVLDLSNNQLQTINVEVFTNKMSGLKTLHIAGNPFLCDCKLRSVWLWSQKQGIIPSEPQINCTNVHRESVDWKNVQHLDCKEEEEESHTETRFTDESTVSIPGCTSCTEKNKDSDESVMPESSDSKDEDRGNKILVGVSLFFLLAVILVVLPLLFIMRKKYGSYKVTKPKPRVDNQDASRSAQSPSGQSA